MRLRPAGEFTAEPSACWYVRDAPLEAGVDAVRFPGGSGTAAQEARLRDGVPVQEFCWERLERLAAGFGIPPLARFA